MNGGISYDVAEFSEETASFNEVLSFGFTGANALVELGPISTPAPIDVIISGICQNVPGTSPPGCEPDVNITGATTLVTGSVPEPSSSALFGIAIAVLVPLLWFKRLARLCFARKVCRFARKICRLASKRQKMAHGTASGSAPQPLTKGPQNTIPTPLCDLSSPKKVTLPERFAGIVRKICREEQGAEVFRAQKCPKSASVFAAKVCGKFAPHGNTFWQRPRAMLATCNAVDMPENSLQPFYCWELAAYKLKVLSGLNRRQTFVAIAANLCGKAQR